MYLEPGARISSHFHADASGLLFKTSAGTFDRFSVAHVVDGSPADEAGIAVGDVLLSVDDRPAESFSLESLKIALQGTGEICLRLERDGATRKTWIKLKPLIAG